MLWRWAIHCRIWGQQLNLPLYLVCAILARVHAMRVLHLVQWVMLIIILPYSLVSNRISANGAGMLADALMYTLLVILLWFLHFYALVLYSLDGNSITDTGAGMLADALKVNHSLQDLRSAAESTITILARVYAMRVLRLVQWVMLII